MRIRKITALFLVISMMACVFSINAHASNVFLSESQSNLLSDALIDVEAEKDTWGLSNVNFQTLSIGNAVQSFEYKNGQLIRSFVMYPIIHDEQLVLWAIPVNGHFQISNSLVDEVNSHIGFAENFVLLYDRNGVHAYTGDTMRCLVEYEDSLTTRSKLTTDVLTRSTVITQADYTKLIDNVAIHYNSRVRNTGYAVTCNVSRVVQTGDYTCWAASIACISNCVLGTSYDDVTVAKRITGSQTNYDVPLYFGDALSALSQMQLSWYSTYGASLTRMYSSIANNHPVLAFFSGYGASNHYCTVYGANSANGRIMIVDPREGYASVNRSSDGYYVYVSPLDAITFELQTTYCYTGS